MEPIRVLHVMRRAQGGMREHVECLLRGLDRELFYPLLACPRDSVPQFLPEHIPVIDVGSRTGGVWSDLGAVIRLARVIKSSGVDIVHTHGARAALWGGIAACLARAGALVATFHNDVYREEAPGWKKGLLKWLLRVLDDRVDYYIAVSSALAARIEVLQGIRPDKLAVITNGIDLARFDSLSPPGEIIESLGGQKRKIVGMVARLVAEKGVSHFLRMASRVARAVSGAFFVVAGEGPERRNFEQEARVLGLGRQISFLGYVPQGGALFKLFDVAVIPSLREGWPYVAMEAMASGRPVVAYASGGLKEVIEDGQTGFLVPTGDVQALAERVVSLLRNEALGRELGRRARLKVERDYTAAGMIARAASIYREVMLARGGREFAPVAE